MIGKNFNKDIKVFGLNWEIIVIFDNVSLIMWVMGSNKVNGNFVIKNILIVIK